MLKKHSILLGIIISISLLLIATLYYPGGSQVDKNAIGFDWKNNVISNLFGEYAVNGAINTARYWAVGGMFVLSASFTLFFIEFSKRIPAKGAAKIIRYAGASSMVFTALIATPLHDLMITISSTLLLVSIFYITVFVFKSKLHVFKFLCTLCLLVLYTALYLYGAGYLKFLPIVQKIVFASKVVLILGLTYFTKTEDFQQTTKVA